MPLTQQQIEAYNRDGFLEIPSLFSPEEVAVLRKAFDRDCGERGPFVIRESKDDGIRALYGSHMRQPEFDQLVKTERFLGYAQQLVDYELYLYQFKINSKPAFGGESWAWHHDFSVWRTADQLPLPRQVNAALFLDDVTEFNGPIIFIPGSHRMADKEVDVYGSQETTHVDPAAYSPSLDQMMTMVKDQGMVSPKGPAGSVVFFHSEVVHGSSTNMSPFPRRLLIVTYNDVDNAPRTNKPRADYIICPVTSPLSVDDRALVPESA